MKIQIEFIPHFDQRYDTPGDWFWTPSGDLMIRVSELEVPEYEHLIAIHELVEALLCKNDGISARAVDKFDAKWKPRELGDGTKITEPGEDPDAPYYKQHVLAEIIERLCAKAMHVHWGEYGTAVERLMRLARGPKSE